MSQASFFSWLVWNPDRNIFYIPYFHHPITWYGVLFALGFFIAYFLVRAMLTDYFQSKKLTLKSAKERALLLTDRLTLLIILGTIIGARLGHVFFYDWLEYKKHPLEIFKVWEGGLASHGAAIGILIAIVIFILWSRKKFPELHFFVILDAIVIPAALVGTFIRTGNFINQEILGKPTDLPWGVIFENPMDGIAWIPLHPVQLYEALFYLGLFILLFLLWKYQPSQLGKGRIAGLFFVGIFGFRFFIEFLKLPQSSLIDESYYGNVGQLLSIPFVIVGLWLFFISFKKQKLG